MTSDMFGIEIHIARSAGFAALLLCYPQLALLATGMIASFTGLAADLCKYVADWVMASRRRVAPRLHGKVLGDND
jgi:hypothetical protein